MYNKARGWGHSQNKGPMGAKFGLCIFGNVPMPMGFTPHKALDIPNGHYWILCLDSL
jgi:hypothetical protein